MTIFFAGAPDAEDAVTPAPSEFTERALRLPPMYPISRSENPDTPFVPTTPESAWWDTLPTIGSDGTNPGSVHDFDSYQRKHDPTTAKLDNFWKSLDKDKELLLAKGYIPGRNPKVYSGIDMKPFMTLPGRDPFEFGDIQTLSVSTHSESFPARILGTRNPIGFTRGARTVAGSIIFTTLDMYPWYKAIKSAGEPIWNKGGAYPLADSLPSFDITITMSNEYEIYGAQMALYGVRIIDDGVVLSIDDLVTENTYSYMAQGIAPIHRARNWLIGEEEDQKRWKAE